MILALCGYGENGEGMRARSGLDGVGQAINGIVAYPTGIRGNWRERPSDLADEDTEYLNGIIRGTGALEGRRYAVGTSDGGCKLACDIDRLQLDRIVVYAGYIMPGTRPLQRVAEGARKVRALFIRGKKDKLVPMFRVQRTRDLFDAAGHDTAFHDAEGGHLVPGTIDQFFFDPDMLPLIQQFYTAA